MTFILNELQHAQQHHWDRGGVLDQVSQMLPTPAHSIAIKTSIRDPIPDSRVLDIALAHPYHGRYQEQKRERSHTPATAVRFTCARLSGRRHTHDSEHIHDDLRVRRQHIRQDDIAKLPVAGLGDPAIADAQERREEPLSAADRQLPQRENECDQQRYQVREW